MKDAVGAMSGCQASGTVSGAPLFILPPLPPPRPSPGPSPRPWDARRNRGGLLRSGRPFSDVVERLTRRTADNPPFLPIVPAPTPFINFFFFNIS